MREGADNNFNWSVNFMLYLLNHGLSVAIYVMLLEWSNELNSRPISMEISAREDINASNLPKYELNKEAWKYDSSCTHNILSYNWTNKGKWISGLALQIVLKNVNHEKSIVTSLFYTLTAQPQKSNNNSTPLQHYDIFMYS